MTGISQFVRGMLAILLCYWAGEFIVILFQLPLPGALLGLVLLLSFLLLREREPVSVSRAGQPLLKHMALLFIPAGVGVGAYSNQIIDNALGLFLAIFVSTLVSLGLSAKLGQYVLASRAK